MKEAFNWLVQNSEIIFSAVVTASTVCYAILTRRLVSETRKMREVQTEPKIHITIESFAPSINIVRLNIQNIGLGPASDLQFEPAVIEGGESAEGLLNEFTNSNFFKTGFRHFAPGQNIYSTYTDIIENLEGKMSSILSFKLSYKSATGKKYTDEIILDMSELKGTYQLNQPSLYSIAKSLEKIEKKFWSITDGFKRIKVNTYSDKDRKVESENIKKWSAEQKAQHKN